MLLVAQRKLESIRVLDDVLERVKVIVVPPFQPDNQNECSHFTMLSRIISGKRAPQGDNFTFRESCCSYCSVDAGVGTDPLMANHDSKNIIFLINCLA